MPRYYEVLIGPKVDPFCFTVIPSNSSEGDLCYRADFGAQYFNASIAGGGALRIDLNAKSIVGNVTSEVRPRARADLYSACPTMLSLVAFSSKSSPRFFTKAPTFGL